jgi:hypothetical protein
LRGEGSHSTVFNVNRTCEDETWVQAAARTGPTDNTLDDEFEAWRVAAMGGSYSDQNPD